MLCTKDASCAGLGPKGEPALRLYAAKVEQGDRRSPFFFHAFAQRWGRIAIRPEAY
jgi:hypothetical protein